MTDDDAPTLYALDLYDDSGDRVAFSVLFTATRDRSLAVAHQVAIALGDLHGSDGFTLRPLEAVEFFYDVGTKTRKGKP